jgi:hypothetical protein
VDGIKGQGHYVGTVMGYGAHHTGWWGEGEITFYMDGDGEFATIVGTGTEDYFSSGWYYDRGFYSAPYHGITIKDDPPGRVSTYRWHIEDAIPFEKSIKVTIEHGTNNDHSADYSSIAFYYQTEPHTPAPPLPTDSAALLPVKPPEVKHFPDVIEAEDLVPNAKPTTGIVSTQSMHPFVGDWSGESQFFWTAAENNATATLTVKVPTAGEYSLAAYFTKAPDYGMIQFMKDTGAIGKPIDLYSTKVETSGLIPIGRTTLAAGANAITIKIVGKNEKSTNNYVGIDALRIAPARKPATTTYPSR